MNSNSEDSLNAKLIVVDNSSSNQDDLQNDNRNNDHDTQWDQSAILTLALCWALTL